jgi:hypothetical protein
MSYVVYIDESGDEGFKNSSSKYFCFGAIIIKKENDLELPRFQKKVLKDISQNKRTPLKHIHFAALKHEQRKYICDSLAENKLPIRAFIVISDKRNISDQLTKDFNEEKSKLFHYLVRHLLERISWFIRDDRANVSKTAEVIFSNRKQLKMEKVKEYLKHLKNDKSCRIEWSAFDIENVRVVNHDQLAGLQFADVFATAFRHYAFEGLALGVDTGYAKTLKPFLYKRAGSIESYGLKTRGIDLKSLNRETEKMLKEDFGFKLIG